MKTTYLPPGAEIRPIPVPAERHETNLWVQIIRSYTHPVLSHGPETELGTAVLLRKNDRLFAFTAAHNVEKGSASIFVGLGPRSERTEFGILSGYIHPEYVPGDTPSKFDLAILELEPNPTVKAGDIEQLYTGEFRQLDGEKDRAVLKKADVWLVGYPTELVDQVGGKIRIYQAAFGTQILELTPDELSVYYPETGYQTPQDGFWCEVGEMPRKPKGYSGGGVWGVLEPEDGDVFNPYRHIKLVGIETYWTPGVRMARCVPSTVIAKSLKDFQPEL